MRIKNLFRNSFFSMLSQFALLILGFFSQRAMNLYMGAELVGMNGVISNVINILSVTELGISTAIVYHLYGALARKDEAEIASLMNLIFRYGWKMLVFLSAIENWIYSSPWFLPMVRFSHFPSLRIPDSGYRGLLQSSLFLSRLRDSPKAVIRYISR